MIVPSVTVSRFVYVQSSPLYVDSARITLVGPEGAQRPASFQATAYYASLRSDLVGRTLLVSAELPSTQTLLHQNFAHCPDGTLCVADTQSSGKGTAFSVLEVKAPLLKRF